LAIILALAAFLLLFHLDHRPFWQDEAETAGLARNVLKYGVPRSYDGVNIISQEQGREYDQNFLWRWSPWLQIYIAAAGFKIGGLTTYAGRFPCGFGNCLHISGLSVGHSQFWQPRLGLPGSVVVSHFRSLSAVQSTMPLLQFRYLPGFAYPLRLPW
jgi:hypothetical protein